MIAVAAADNDEECVCSPRQFYFKLNLSASCPVLPPPFPPNDVFGAGVKDYTCSIGLEPVQNDAGEFTLDEEEFVEPSGEDEDDSAGERNVVTNSNDDSITAAASSASLFAASQSTTSNHDSSGQRRRRRRHLQQDDGSSTGVVVTYNSNSSASDFSPKVDIQWSSVNFTTSALTTTAQVDVTPVVIYSIQFLEVDTSFNVINMDSTYVHGIAIVSGDVFTYTSISATNRGVVPGGMNMVLRGVNANGDLVRNVFTILYTNECGVPTFKEGDAIGWVVFDNFEPASKETCRCGSSIVPSPGGGKSAKVRKGCKQSKGGKRNHKSTTPLPTFAPSSHPTPSATTLPPAPATSPPLTPFPTEGTANTKQLFF